MYLTIVRNSKQTATLRARDFIIMRSALEVNGIEGEESLVLF